MRTILGIKELYIPVQPTIKNAGTDIVYQEFLPANELQEYIYCYWQLKTNKKISSPFTYRVVADGCIDIFFNLNKTSDRFVMGFCDKYTTFSLEYEFNYIGIRFFPTIFPQLYKIDASTLSNRYEHLDNVVTITSDFIENNIDANQDIEYIIDALNNHFLSVVTTANIDDDRRMYDALNIILQKQGVLNIETDLNTGVSNRQLRRLFEFYVGTSCKTFSKVVRFQNILKAKPSQQSLKQNKLFLDVGYFDQSHFIKDFKAFYGITPGKVFDR